MPRQVVEIDPYTSAGQAELLAWCAFPQNDEKRQAFIVAHKYAECVRLEQDGHGPPDWSWPEVKTLWRMRKKPTKTLTESEKKWRFEVPTARLVLERVLTGEAKNTTRAVKSVVEERRAYFLKKGKQGSQSAKTQVMNRMWSQYKSVVHLALAFNHVQRENIPTELTGLSEGREAEILWKIEDGDPNAPTLGHDPSGDDFARALDLAEQIRRRMIDHPKIRIADDETIQFVAMAKSG